MVRAIVVRAIVVRAIVTIIGGTAMKGRPHATTIGMSTMTIQVHVAGAWKYRGAQTSSINFIRNYMYTPTPYSTHCIAISGRWCTGNGDDQSEGPNLKMGKDHHSNISKTKNKNKSTSVMIIYQTAV